MAGNIQGGARSGKLILGGWKGNGVMETQTFFGTQFLLLLPLLRRSPNFPVEIYALGRIGERIGRRWQKKFFLIFYEAAKDSSSYFPGKTNVFWLIFPRIKEPNFPFTAENSNFSLFTQITLNGSNKKGEREGKGYTAKKANDKYSFSRFFFTGETAASETRFFVQILCVAKGWRERADGTYHYPGRRGAGANEPS